ncbi:MAG: YcaO-related McrA-glycine thioamidation protein [Candidatus Methanomethylophilaceae archaeon]|nr:YcaO-related McrA-glycine thioamidation protein [Candidatus Methanomethylophilaceae archaeon]
MGIQLNRCPKVSASTGIRTIPPEETLKRVIPLLEKAGMDPLEDITDRDNLGIPVYSIYRKRTAKGTFGNYNGKGATPEQAKASAVMEAMERYSAEQRESDEVAYGTLQQMRDSGMPYVEPADLILPARVMGMVESAEIAWTECYDILRGEDVWVPACAVFYPYYPDGDLQLFRFHTNGIASGNTIEEAILHAMFEVIERDAWSIAESFNRTNADIIVDDEDSVPGRLLKQFRDAGIEINLKDLTTDVGVTTVGASSDDVRTKDPEMLDIGVGTHLNPEIAAIRALTEVAQSRTTHKHGLKVNAELQKKTREMGYEKVKEANALWYRDSSKSIRLSEMKDEATDYVLDDIELVLGKIMDAGFDRVIIADLTRPEIDVPTVRAIIPGMEVSTMDSEREGLRAWGRWGKRP